MKKILALIMALALVMGLAVTAFAADSYSITITPGTVPEGGDVTGVTYTAYKLLDANITTLIAAVVLLFFGTGSVQGFAKTLLLGVVVSMFSAVLVTRFLMNNIVALGAKNVKLFMAVKAEKEEQA